MIKPYDADTDIELFPKLDHDTRCCLRLWSAVLRQGIADASLGYKDLVTLREKTPEATLRGVPHTDNKTALLWMLRDDNGIGGFAWMCDALGYNPEAVRNTVKHRVERRVG